MESTLQDLGPVALSHRDEVNEVKGRLGITHAHFDCWIFGFLENKKFNIEETVAKLQRRFAMEINELATYEFTDYMRDSLRKGIIQVIGDDKEGRVTFYITTRRDFPSSKHRDEQRRTFDMFVSYGTRLRKENKRCQITMLINQDKASMWSNVDMTFQADVALRIAKYYPGCVAKMYICNMGRALAAMAKPIFSRLPTIVSERIIIVDEADIKNGKLLDMYDAAVLPVALGGHNDCDTEAHWNAYAEAIETYYGELKKAVTERGLSVKEWELEVLLRETGAGPLSRQSLDTQSIGGGAQAIRAASVMLSTPRSILSAGSSARLRDDDAQSLLTCFSENTEGDLQCAAALARERGLSLEACPTWQQVMAGIPSSLAVFFLEELLRWRTTVEEEEKVERLRILDDNMKLREVMSAAAPAVDIRDKHWYLGIPAPCRDVYKILLTGLIICSCVYFVAALVFLAVLSSTVIITMFLGFFVEASFVFPLAAAVIMATMQGAALCTRGVEILFALYKRRVIPPLEWLGTFWGGIAQITLCAMLCVVQFIIFCVYAARRSPLEGLQISFATGWLSAMFIVALWHVLFFTGVWQSDASRRRSERRGLASLPMLVAFNLHDQQEGQRSYQLRLSSYVISGVPLTISMLLGVGFLISRVISLAVATVIVAVVGAFVVNYYSEGVSSRVSGVLLRIALWMMTLVWLYVVLAFGLRNYAGTWAASVIVASLLSGLFILLSFLSTYYFLSKGLLRVSFILALLLLLSCWIAQFPLVGWRLGVFTLAMILHNTLCILFVRAELTKIHGVFLVSAGIALLLIACLLLGWFGSSTLYLTPQSRPPVPPTAPAPSPLEQYHRYPVCALTVGANGALGAADLALLTELVTAGPTSVFETDFTNWFGATDFTFGGIVKVFADAYSSNTASIYQFDSAANNVTVLVMDNVSPIDSILTMTAWIDSLALSPLHIFLPVRWAQKIVYVISFVTRMIPFGWRSVTDELTEFMTDMSRTNPRQVLVTGYAIAGGIVSIASARSGTQAVVFGAPGVLHLTEKAGFTREQYRRYVLSVEATSSSISSFGGHDTTMSQVLLCENDISSCRTMQFISKTLVASCDHSGRRHV